MLDMTLGSGIMWASLFLALGTVAVVWINNIYKSKNENEARVGDQTISKNGFVRKGECNATINSLQKELQNNHKENKNWWKQVDEKIDNIQSELLRIRDTTEDHSQRIAALEAVTKTKN